MAFVDVKPNVQCASADAPLFCKQRSFQTARSHDCSVDEMLPDEHERAVECDLWTYCKGGGCTPVRTSLLDLGWYVKSHWKMTVVATAAALAPFRDTRSDATGNDTSFVRVWLQRRRGQTVRGQWSATNDVTAAWRHLFVRTHDFLTQNHCVYLKSKCLTTLSTHV